MVEVETGNIHEFAYVQLIVTVVAVIAGSEKCTSNKGFVVEPTAVVMICAEALNEYKKTSDNASRHILFADAIPDRDRAYKELIILINFRGKGIIVDTHL